MRDTTPYLINCYCLISSLSHCFTSPRTSSGQAGWPYETVPIGTILSPSAGGRKPQGENYQAFIVKGERHSTCSLKSTQAIAVEGERVTLKK